MAPPPRPYAPRLLGLGLALLATAAVLGALVAHSAAPAPFTAGVTHWLDHTAAGRHFFDIALRTTTVPFVTTGLTAVVLLALVRRTARRGVVAAGAVVLAIAVADLVAKPLVDCTYYGALTFPSGHVTAVTATATALALSLWFSTGRVARVAWLVVLSAWVLFVSVAVVGAQWHTPLDSLGGILLGVGVVCALYATAILIRIVRPD